MAETAPSSGPIKKLFSIPGQLIDRAIDAPKRLYENLKSTIKHPLEFLSGLTGSIADTLGSIVDPIVPDFIAKPVANLAPSFLKKPK